MSTLRFAALAACAAVAAAAPVRAQSAAPSSTQAAPPPTQTAPPAQAFDAELAARLGADERGMRHYVLVILKSGPNKVPAGPERDEMFKGHFANIERLAAAGTLAVAGPFAANADGWRGLYLFAVADVEEARKLVATDPAVVKGEMVPELHEWYGSAALMLVPDAHKKIQKPRP
jgi:uncharacterized protein YciI